MSGNLFSKVFKRTNLLPENYIAEYNKSIESLITIQNNFIQGNVNEASKDIESIYNKVIEAEIPIILLIFDALSLYIKILLYKSDFDTIENLLTKNKGIIDSVLNSKDKKYLNKIVSFKLLLATFHYRKGNFQQSENFIEQVNSHKDSVDSTKFKLMILNHLAMFQIMKNNYVSTIQLLQDALELAQEDDSEQFKVALLNNLGLAYLYSGNLVEASKNLESAKEISLKTDNKIFQYMIKVNLGVYGIFAGDIQTASSLLEESLEYFQQIDFNFELANTYINLSSISEIKGEIVQSQSDLTSAIDLSNSLENQFLANICNNNFGNLAIVTGEFDSAKSTYLECYDYFNKHHMDFESLFSLFNLLSLAVLENDSEAKMKYLQNINDINTKLNNSLINLIYQISRGLDLKQHDRMVKIAEAQQIFTNIANNESTIHHEFKVIALKNLCDLLIDELSSSGDQEVIDELKENVNQILKIADYQNSLLLKVESYLIQSKVDLLEFKLNESRTLLSQAQTIAEEKGLTGLAIFISREYDNLLNQIAKFQDQGDLNLSNLSINERLEIAELENMVNRIIRKRAEIPDIKEENPFMFLIIAMSGMSIFSKIFVEENLMDEQLIGGFITAINIVTQQAFSDQDAIEGIRHQDFTLLLKYLGDTRILCVYVFKGQSYFAMQKLKTFIETVQYSDAMQLIDDANDIGKIISEEPPLLNLVIKIFQESDEESIKLVKRNFISQKISSTINPGLVIDDVPLFV